MSVTGKEILIQILIKRQELEEAERFCSTIEQTAGKAAPTYIAIKELCDKTREEVNELETKVYEESGPFEDEPPIE